MPTYHSSFNDMECQQACKAAILPVKTKCKGPAPQADPKETDIIDEALDYFRANVLYKNYSSKGPADLILCYLTVFIGELLRAYTKEKTKLDGLKKITLLTHSQTFKIPGDDGFCLAGFFSPPARKADADLIRAYFRQIREEVSLRLAEKCFNADGSPNKWWMQFSKRKFMGLETA